MSINEQSIIEIYQKLVIVVTCCELSRKARSLSEE